MNLSSPVIRACHVMVIAAAVLALNGCASLGLRGVDAQTRASVETALGAFANSLQGQLPDAKSAYLLLENYVRNNPAVYGAALAYAPETVGGKVVKSAPYAYRKGTGLQVKDLYGLDYDYPAMEWYQAAAASGKPAWSEPYFDKGGGDAWMRTYSVPIMKAGKAIAVLTSDVPVAGK